MMGGRLLLLVGTLLLVCSPLLQAQELQVESNHTLVRPGLLHRFTVSTDDTSRDLQERADLVVYVRCGEQDLMQRQLNNVSIADLRAGVRINWIAPAQWPDQPLRVHARWLRGSPAWSGSAEVDDLLALARQLNQLAEQLEVSGETQALPWLWVEQAALALRNPVDLYAATQLLQQSRTLRAWQQGWRPPTSQVERAFRDPRDQSVQPYRFYAAEEPQRGVVVWLESWHEGDDKSRWPEPAAPLRQAMVAGGWCVLQLYPAGDRHFNGLAVQRIDTALRAVAAKQEQLSVIGYAAGAAAAGHLRRALAAPGSYAALVLSEPRWQDSAEPTNAADSGAQEWRSLRRDPRQRVAHLRNLPGYVQGRGDGVFRDLVARLPELNRAEPEALYEAEFWRKLQLSEKPYLPEYRILRPGPVGPLHISQVTDRQRGGVVTISEQAAVVEGIQVAGVRWTGKPVAGQEIRAPTVADAAQLPPGHLADYARGPFVVVVGSGEHAAARQRNQQLYRQFLADWVAHAQGRPPVVSDQDFRTAEWSGHHLVLIGGPRSNTIAARLQRTSQQPWPVTWDHRTVQLKGQSYLRADEVGVAFVVAHPDQRDRLVVVLDGLPSWSSGGLPLAQQGDLLLRSPERGRRFWVYHD